MVPSLRPAVRDSVSPGSGDEFPDRTFKSGSRHQKSTVLGPESGSFIGENDSSVEFWGPESGSFIGENDSDVELLTRIQFWGQNRAPSLRIF